MRKLCILMGLFGFWACLTLITIVQFDGGFSTISIATSVHPSTQKLLKGQSVTGEFTAQQNNVGILSIRFWSIPIVPYSKEDTLVFRIKQQGQKNWYSQNTYNSNDMSDTPLFPFGFPALTNAQGKTYIFQLISLKGDAANAVSVSGHTPVVIAKYTSHVSKNPKELFHIIFQKLRNDLTMPEIFFASLIYLFPFLLYVFKFPPKVTLFMVLLTTFIDIFYFQSSFPFVYVVLGAVSFFSRENKHLLYSSFFLAILFYVLFLFGFAYAAITASYWACTLFLTGIVSKAWTYKTHEKK